MDNTNKTSRNRITRMRIGESILKLLDNFSLSELKISAIVHAAGISRMTFYHYYETKEAALKDYLSEIINSYVEASKDCDIEDRFKTVEHLEFALDFFAHHDKFILKLEKIGCYNILIDGVNNFLQTYYHLTKNEPIYHLYFYAGALLNVFIEWLKEGKKIPAREVAKIILSGNSV